MKGNFTFKLNKFHKIHGQPKILGIVEFEIGDGVKIEMDLCSACAEILYKKFLKAKGIAI